MPLNKLITNKNLHIILLVITVALISYILGSYNNSMESFANLGSSAQTALPPGIPKSDIPLGEEHLYIKKSEIVPPVCPKCPDINSGTGGGSAKKCPPCPACARCPEPAFECKKVPNYSAVNNNAMPRPVLADFSQFGM